MPLNGPLFFLQVGLGKDSERGPGLRMAALGGDFPPNLASLYGVADARIYNPMAPRAYLDLLAPIVFGWRGEVPILTAPGHPLYGRLGVRYLLTASDAELPPPLRKVYADADAAVWERPGARKRLFLDGESPGGGLTIPRLEDAWITARVGPGSPRPLSSVLYQDGGWRLLVNGAARPTGLDQGVFLTADLPAGASRVDLLYRPAGFLWGWVIAAIGMAAGVAALGRPTAPAAPPPPARP